MIDSTSAFRTNGRYYTWCNKKLINNNLENFPAWPLQSRTVWRHDVHSLRRSDKEPNPSLPDVQSSSWKYFCQFNYFFERGSEWHLGMTFCQKYISITLSKVSINFVKNYCINQFIENHFPWHKNYWTSH